MDFIKYFKDTEYIENKKDCWTFLKEVFKDEHNIELPDYPIMLENGEIASFLTENIPYCFLDEAKKGCIIYYHNGAVHHAGYALNSKEFIHKTKQGVRVNFIPKNAIIYQVLND